MAETAFRMRRSGTAGAMTLKAVAVERAGVSAAIGELTRGTSKHPPKPTNVVDFGIQISDFSQRFISFE